MDKSLWRCSIFELVDSRYIYREKSASLMSQTKSKGHTYTNPRPGQYPTHVHSHVTRAVAAMESCFALQLGFISMAVWWATSLITFTSPPYKSRRSGLLTVLPDDVSKASKAYKRCKACIKLGYVTENLVARSLRSCRGLGKWSVTRRELRRVH